MKNTTLNGRMTNKETPGFQDICASIYLDNSTYENCSGIFAPEQFL